MKMSSSPEPGRVRRKAISDESGEKTGSLSPRQFAGVSVRVRLSPVTVE